MQFNSFVFILLLMPITALLYFVSNKFNEKIGKIIIILASLFFYTYTDVSVAVVLMVSIIVNYLFVFLLSKSSSKKKLFFLFPLIVNIGLLVYYKYTNFAISNYNLIFSKEIPLKEIVLPIGISFFTFQQIAYCVAIYEENLKLNLIDYLAYILYFPKLLMGPLMDPIDFCSQFNDSSLKRVNAENIANGLKIFSYGLFKKLVLADTFSKAVTWGFTNIDTASSMELILVMLFYTFEIYFDFSGYSDMAVGASAILNIKLPFNFDSPYKAISIRDFWKRWHISLTSFFTKYIYIPLGGNRKGALFTSINTMIVFTVSGIWHGANWTFILWGILHGLFSLFDRYLEKIEEKIIKPVRWIVSFGIINLLWILFRADSVSQWIYILKRMIALSDLNVSDGLVAYSASSGS